MTFNSLQYAAFLAGVLLIYWRLPMRGQNLLLLGASYWFYGAFDWRFLGLLLCSTTTDYTVGLLMNRRDHERWRRTVFGCSLAVNLGILGFFKYYDFFSGEGIRLLHHLHVDLAPPVLRILLPVGISFYTFHGISYTFDVYRRRIEPCRDPIAFAVFVAFFPQLVAGPIGRAERQLPQFRSPRRRPDRAETGRAVGLILVGLFKKVAIADTLAPYVDTAFRNPTQQGSVTLLLSVYAFALQIYGDFGGYTDIARGSAALLGIELPLNFAQPYLSRSVTEFWRRWHISLSSWLRDYLYVPLGGNRGPAWATYRNLIITMLLGGLWHGAAATFVVWGGLHGSYLAAERRFLPAADRDAGRPWSWRRDPLRAFATFNLVCVAWVFFRATGVRGAGHYLLRIGELRPGPVDRNLVLVLAAATLATLAVDVTARVAPRPAAGWRRGVAYGAMVTAVVLCSGGTPVPFIYFRF
ncbi:MAG TPA: MBOAT family protein [Acidimicrobiales bacterium]|nr:MBOAT family protein [Acidimicrobiales bacterium]